MLVTLDILCSLEEVKIAFKKHRWMSYGKKGNIIEIKIKDESDNPIDTFKCNNNEAFKIIAKIIRDKYGFDFGVSVQSKKVEEEIDWIKILVGDRFNLKRLFVFTSNGRKG